MTGRLFDMAAEGELFDTRDLEVEPESPWGFPPDVAPACHACAGDGGPVCVRCARRAYVPLELGDA